MSLPPSGEDFAIYQFYHTTLENLAQEDPARYLHTHLLALYHECDAESALRLATQAISYASSTKFGRNAAQISRKRSVRAIMAVKKSNSKPRRGQKTPDSVRRSSYVWLRGQCFCAPIY